MTNGGEKKLGNDKKRDMFLLEAPESILRKIV
jgi:hypothetical protein